MCMATSHSLYQQLRLELVQLVRKWESIHLVIANNDGPLPDSYFVEYAGLYQYTRSFMRLLNEEYAEDACVVSETVCTLILSGFVTDSIPLRKQSAQVVEAMCRIMHWHMGAHDGDKNSIDAALYKGTLRLQRYVHTGAPQEYQHFSRPFPVNAYEDDGAPLRIRGFDLLRLEAEALSLYLLEFDWSGLIERGGTVYGLFAHSSHNGHVFDVRHAKQAYYEPTPYTGGVLRLLYGTPLELDFVQAIARVPGSQIFAVDKTRIFSHEPSWGLASSQATMPLVAQPITMDDLTPLIDAYDVALNRLFAEAKAPRAFEPMEGYEEFALR